MSTPTTSSSVTNVSLTSDHNINALIFGQKWASSTITYSVPGAGASWSLDPVAGYGLATSDGEPWHNFSALTAPEVAQFKVAMQLWANVANLQFVQSVDTASTVGDIRIGFSGGKALDGAQAIAYLPDGTPLGGDIWFNADSTSFGSNFENGSYSFITLLHELGHALGLKHPFESDQLNATVIDTQFDSKLYTVMSYSATPGDQDTWMSYYPTTPMLYDIAAMQALYGKNTTYNAGDTVYTFGDSTTYMQTIWDAGGTNSITYTGSKAATIDLREGHGSTLGKEVDILDASGDVVRPVQNVWIAFDTQIQNATGGSASNAFIGNDLANTLTGGNAGNFFTGGAGNDSFIGGSGIDTAVYTGTRANYNIVKTTDGYTVTALSGNEGTDTLLGVERLSFADTGLALDISGNAGKAYRLYQASFDRVPDKPGLSLWIQALDKGMTLETAADLFERSAEFIDLYGANLTNAQIVTRFYENTLHREPEPAGQLFWEHILNTHELTVQQVLAQFSESPENQAQVIGSIQNGIEYTLLG